MSTSMVFAVLTMIVWAPHMSIWWALGTGVWFAGWAVYYMRKGD